MQTPSRTPPSATGCAFRINIHTDSIEQNVQRKSARRTHCQVGRSPNVSIAGTVHRRRLSAARPRGRLIITTGKKTETKSINTNYDDSNAHLRCNLHFTCNRMFALWRRFRAGEMPVATRSARPNVCDKKRDDFCGSTHVEQITKSALRNKVIGRPIIGTACVLVDTLKVSGNHTFVP